MKKSESIANLMTALQLAQKQMKPVAKNASNPFFKSSYADLPNVWENIKEALGSQGLAVSQTTQVNEFGTQLVTLLGHKSGEWICGEYPLNPVKNDPQGIGSATTYARRYALMAIVGAVASDEDDDGNYASGNTAREQPRPAMHPAQTKLLDKREEPRGQARTGWKPSEAQVKRLFAIAKSSGWHPDALKAKLMEKIKADDPYALSSKEQYDLACGFFEKNKFVPEPPPIKDDGLGNIPF